MRRVLFPACQAALTNNTQQKRCQNIGYRENIITSFAGRIAAGDKGDEKCVAAEESVKWKVKAKLLCHRLCSFCVS